MKRHGVGVGSALIVAAGAVALAACGGPSAPRVASLGGHGNGGSARTTTTLPEGDPTQLVNEWATCMRSHGDSAQADPIIDSNRDIDIAWNAATPGGPFGTNKGGQGNDGPGQYCRSYLNAAQTALGGNRQGQAGQSQATLERFSRCMRANGIADFPDPVNDSLSFNLGATGDLNPNNAVFQSASKLCAQRTGAQLPGLGGTPPPPGVVKLNGQSPP